MASSTSSSTQAGLALSGSTAKIAVAVMLLSVAGMVKVALLASSASVVTLISVSEPAALTSQPVSV